MSENRLHPGTARPGDLSLRGSYEHEAFSEKSIVAYPGRRITRTSNAERYAAFSSRLTKRYDIEQFREIQRGTFKKLAFFTVLVLGPSNI
jgi:hypothetical protein